MAGLFGGGKSTVNEAERISQFQVNQATYGEVVPIVFGTTRISGNIIDYFNFVAVRHAETQSAGKGGSTSTTNVTYTYNAAVLIGLCEGPIDGIGTVWKDTDTVTTLAGAGLTLFNGAYGQAPWSYALSSAPDRALPYSGLAYAAGYIELNSSAGVPTLNFEVQGLLRSSGDGTDCNPAAVLMYVLGNSINGIGLTESDVDRVCLQNFWNYCAAADLYISLPATDQTVAYEIVNTICEALNTIVFWSQDGFKLVPRCDETITGHGVTYAPDLTPLYDLDEDDFIADDDGRHVRFERSDNADAYNQCQVEFINRANSYETETTDYQVSSDVNRRGLRPMSKTYHFFHTKARASYVAQMQATQSCFNRLTYLFRLGWTHCLLEPGDLVSLTVNYGPDRMDKVLVRIETFKELQDEDGFDVTATPVLAGTYAPAKYATYEAERGYIDYDVAPGDARDPVFFQIPAVLTSGIQKVLVAASGKNKKWGGCNFYGSDDGDTYREIGKLDGPSRYGNIIKDSGSEISVDVSISGATILGGTSTDAANGRTLCYVEGELFSYANAKLVSANQYVLSGCVRGQYGTQQATHKVGSKFVRLDMDRLFAYEYTANEIGKTIYVKLQSYNVFGSGIQDIDILKEYSYEIVNVCPPDVKTLMVETMGSGIKRISWEFLYPIPNDIAGFRIKYNIGNSLKWETATNLFSGLVAASPCEISSIPGGTVAVLVKAVDAAGNESKEAAYAIIGIGDELVENVLIEADLSNGNAWDGNKYECNVNGKYLVANSSEDSMYPIDLAASLYPVNDRESFFTANWPAMMYQKSVSIDCVGTLSFDCDIDGNSQLFYRQQYPYAFYGADYDKLYPADTDEMFKEGPWSQYAGKVQVTSDVQQFKVSIKAGKVQGILRKFVAVIDTPDVSEIVNDIPIAIGGTQIPITKKYIRIKNVNITIQDNGTTTAVAARCVNKDPDGPIIVLINKNNEQVSGIVDVTIQGY